MFLVVMEDGSQVEFVDESHVPDDDSVTLVIELDERDQALTKYVREGGQEMVVALSGLLMKGFNRGFLRGREDEKLEGIMSQGLSPEALRGFGPGPRPGLFAELAWKLEGN